MMTPDSILFQCRWYDLTLQSKLKSLLLVVQLAVRIKHFLKKLLSGENYGSEAKIYLYNARLRITHGHEFTSSMFLQQSKLTHHSRRVFTLALYTFIEATKLK
jgi:hypothetical protein